MTPEPERLTRDQQREAARAKARELREQQKKSDKRKRLMLQLGVVFGVLLVTLARRGGARDEAEILAFLAHVADVRES